jgi:hypothetical protein
MCNVCTAVYTFIGIKIRASTRYEVVDYEDIRYSHTRFRYFFFGNLILLGYWDGQYFSLISLEATVNNTSTPRLVR